MANATVENVPVSKQFSDSGSVTVPSGETWHVTITASVTNASDVGFTTGEVEINSVNLLNISYSANSSSSGRGKGISEYQTNVVLTGGDTVSINSRDSGIDCTITGFVVN